MAKRYGMNTPAVRKRREKVKAGKAAEYQSRLMPNPGTPAWSQGLETSTPFFDIATVGMGGGLNLLRKGIGRKLAESRLRRQPAYTSPSTAMQDHRFFTGLKDDRLQRDAWNREFALDKWRKQADDDAISFAGTRTRAGAEFQPDLSEIEAIRRRLRRRRAQASIGDDMDIADYRGWDYGYD